MMFYTIQVNAICVAGAYLYIVGTTEGQIEGGSTGIIGGAFVLKMEIATRQMEWSRQISGKNVEGLGCAVSQHVVYVGGNTNEVLEQGQAQTGGQQQQHLAYSQTKDIFVSALSKTDGGQTLWTKQLDSTNYFGNETREDDFVSMYINSDGDVGVYFNSMIKNDDEDVQNDVVLVSLDKSTGKNEFDGLGGGGVSSKSQTNDDNNKAIIIPAVVVPIFLSLLVFGWHFSQHRVEHVKRPHDNDHDLSFQPEQSGTDAKVFV
jgi:hypothetical protein